MKCEICGRKTENVFCKLHEEANENLLGSYESWKKAMNITLEEYLKKILKNPLTGAWAKEVATHLLASGLSKSAFSQTGNQIDKV